MPVVTRRPVSPAPNAARRALRPVAVGFSLALFGACTGEVVPQHPSEGLTGTQIPGDNSGAGNVGTGNNGAGSTGGSSTSNPGPTGMAATPPPVAACMTANPAPVFHRLNRTEYQNSVNSLLGTNLALRDDLPVDSLVYGLDNNADTAISAPLAQKYLTIAQKAVDAALADSAVRGRLVPCNLGSTTIDKTCARQVLTAFLPRAFRRPIETSEVDDYLKYTDVCTATPQAGLSCALQAALVSPRFLFRAELLDAEAAAPTCSATKPLTSTNLTLSPYALATRLAYFLWSGPPDQELFDLAAQGKLTDPAVIEAQVNRMLRPDLQQRSVRPFSESLPVQWLEIDGVESVTPSKTLFPSFDEPLRKAIAAESRFFFQEILQQNRSALELLRAPYTFVNDRLAAHYGIKGVTGSDFRKVDTTGTPRGGVLTQASFLTTTSSSENTSIVLRARWVLHNLLCTSIPDPPPGSADAVPAPDPGLGLTNRESLERRTANAPCNACHEKLNPLGFALEIFDPIGAQRSTDKGKPIDPSGVLPTGERFKDTEELLALLQKDERFSQCLTRKLATYALGRSISSKCDEEVVKSLSDEFKRDGYRLKNHVVRIAKSQLFRSVASH